MRTPIRLAAAAAMTMTLAACVAPATSTSMTTTSWTVPATNDLRSGPDAEFPVVARIPANAQMTIEGCLQGWTWCDVSWNGQRGWIAGNEIQTVYQDQPVYIRNVGPDMHVPVVTYDTATYWDSNYRSAPFYTQRERYRTWVRRP